MARDETLRVTGYRELLRACQRAEKDSRLYLRHELRHVGDIVRADAAQRFSGYSAKSAAGFKVRVRQRGVSVEQSLRKTTGKHPEFGALQMVKALIPARHDKQGEITEAFTDAMNKVADRFEHT